MTRERDIDAIETLHGQKATLEEFLALPETNRIVELIEGVITVSPAHARHQILLSKLFALLIHLMESGDLLLPGTGVVFGDMLFEPDILYISRNNTECILKDGLYYGPPDLTIEILSPSTASRDRGIKFKTYEQSGVKEYWIVDPVNNKLEIYVQQDGKFSLQGEYKPDDAFTTGIAGDLKATFFDTGDKSDAKQQPATKKPT